MDKITSIYANGCSFTEGCELFSCKYNNFDKSIQGYGIDKLRKLGFNEFADFNYNNNFTALLANRLGLPFINESISGNINQNIINETVKHLNKIKNDSKKTLFIIGLTDINRMFFVSDNSISFLSKSNKNKKHKLAHAAYSLCVDNYFFFNLINHYFLIKYLINNFNNSHNPYVIFDALTMYCVQYKELDILSKTIDNSKFNEQVLELSNYYDLIKDSPSNTFELINLIEKSSFAYKNINAKLPVCSGGHPGIEAHQYWSEVLENEVRNKYPDLL